MRRSFLTVVLLLLAVAATAETISYQIVALSSDDEGRVLAEGIRDYTLEDFEVRAHSAPEHWIKTLFIAEEFWIGATVYRKKSVSGFGLWIKRTPRWFEIWSTGGSSWEWFYRETGNIYRKLQGSGRVAVTMTEATDYEELAKIEFLDDVTMRLSNDPWLFFTTRETHHMVIAKGSVLRLAP